MNPPPSPADSMLRKTIKEQLKVYINLYMMQSAINIMSNYGMDAKIKAEDYYYKRDELEELFTSFLDIDTVMTDPDNLYDKLHRFEEKVLKYYLVFLKARYMLEDPLSNQDWTHDILDSESCFDLKKFDEVFDLFANDMINEYVWQIEECLQECE